MSFQDFETMMFSGSKVKDILLTIRQRLYPSNDNASKPFPFWGYYTQLALKHCANSKYHRYLVGSPYEWDTENTKLVLTNSKWRWAWWKFNLVFCLIIWHLFIGVCVRALLNGQLDIRSPIGIMRAIACLVTGLVILLAWTILIYLRSMVALLNSVVRSYEEFKGKALKLISAIRYENLLIRNSHI